MFKRSVFLIVALCLPFVVGSLGETVEAQQVLQTPPTAPEYMGLPDLAGSANANSGKFLIVGGDNNFGISTGSSGATPKQLVLRLQFPVTDDVKVAVFDGDTIGNWDQRDNLFPVSVAFDTRFRLFPDPTGDVAMDLASTGTTTAVAEVDATALGTPAFSTDEQWVELKDGPGSAAATETAGGTQVYNYTLQILLEAGPNGPLSEYEVNGFKLAFNGTYLFTEGTIIGFMGGVVDSRTPVDLSAKTGRQESEDPRPDNLPGGTAGSGRNTYDGVFEFPFDASNVCTLKIFEADADWSAAVTVIPDPSALGRPPDDARIYAVDFGGSTGVIAIDNRDYLVSPAVAWDIVAPDATAPFNSVANTPAGHASINAQGPAALGGGFQQASGLTVSSFQSQPGVWKWRWTGVDARNAIWLMAEGFGTTPSTLTGNLYCDTNANGVFDTGEMGLGGQDVHITPVGSTTPIIVTTNGAGQWSAALPGGLYDLTVPGAPFPSLVALPIRFDACEPPPDVPFDCQGSICGRVWCDNNQDNVYNVPPDSPLVGVTVTATPVGGGQSFTAMTTANGQYQIAVPLGNYTVSVNPADANLNGATPLIPNPPSRTPVAVTTSTCVPNNDFTFLCTGGLSGRAWCDDNQNSLFDSPPELAKVGYTVTATPAQGAAQTANTAANGTYSFTGLTAGVWQVQITTLVGDVLLSTNPQAVTVVAGQNVPNIDFRFLCQGGVSGRVWCDNDQNSTYVAPPDTPLPGVTVTATPTTGLPVIQTTGPSGTYAFTGLAAGTWTISVNAASVPNALPISIMSRTVTVVANSSVPNIDFRFLCIGDVSGRVYCDNDQGGSYVVPPDSPIAGAIVTATPLMGTPVTQTTGPTGTYAFTGLAAGTWTISVNPANPPLAGKTQLSAVMRTVTVVPNQPVTDVDFRFLCLGDVSGRVYCDNNDDSTFVSPPDGALVGVQVTATHADGTVVGPLPTAASGMYAFTGLKEGVWTISLSPSTDPALINATLLSTNPRIVTVVPGQAVTDVDFRFKCPGKISGTVIREVRPCDGIFQPGNGEVGLGGVQVELLNAAGVPVATTTTSSVAPVGYYEFDNVTPGTWSVRVKPGDGVFSILAPFGPTALGPITLGQFDSSTGNDFFFCPGEICVKVVRNSPDTDNCLNQIDGTDLPVGGVRVTLTPMIPGGVPVDAFTNPTGEVCFSNLDAANYAVTVDGTSAGLLNLGPAAGAEFQTVTLAPGAKEELPSVWCGCSITGKLITDPCVPAWAARDFPGVTVQLFQLPRLVTTPPYKTTVTTAGGAFSFPTLPKGDYVVVVPSGQATVGFYTLPIPAITPQDCPADVTFLYEAPGVTITTFIDVDCDGTGDQPGSFNVSMEKKDNPGFGQTWTGTTVAGTGLLRFATTGLGLPSGNYEITVLNAPAGTTSPTTKTVFLPECGNTDVPFIFCIPPGSIHGIVYREPAGDCSGTYTFGTDTPIDNVEVKLYKLDDATGIYVQVGSATTPFPVGSAAGTYTFANLVAGTYQVEVNETTLTPVDVLSATSPALVSGVNLTPGDDEEIDFGWTAQEISGYVFEEPQGLCDGIFNTGDLPIGGVQVQVTRTTPATPGFTAAVFTDAVTGFYRFEDLPVGQYDVKVVDPALLLPLLPSSPELLTPALRLCDKSEDQNFGFCPPVPKGKICGTVFLEPYGKCDGIYNTGDSGIPGVAVTITALPSGRTASKMTDGLGDYCFDNLPAGTYEISVFGGQPVLVTLTPTTPILQLIPLAAGEEREDVDFGYCPPCPRGPCCEGDLHEVIVETRIYHDDPYVDLYTYFLDGCEADACEIDYAGLAYDGEFPGGVAGYNDVIHIETVRREGEWLIVRLRLTAQGCAFPRGFFGDKRRSVVVEVNGKKTVGCVSFRCEYVRNGSWFTWTQECGMPECEIIETPVRPDPFLVQASLSTWPEAPIGCDARFYVLDTYGWENWLECEGRQECKEQSETCICGYNRIELELDYWVGKPSGDQHDLYVELQKWGTGVMDGFQLSWTGDEWHGRKEGCFVTVTDIRKVIGGDLEYHELWRVTFIVQACDRADGNPRALPAQMNLATTLDDWTHDFWIDLADCGEQCLELGPRMWNDEALGINILRWLSVEDAAWCPPVKCREGCAPQNGDCCGNW